MDFSRLDRLSTKTPPGLVLAEAALIAAKKDAGTARSLRDNLDFHVNDIMNLSVQFPMECNDKPMTAQEKALEFLLFDLASCVQPDEKPPQLIP